MSIQTNVTIVNFQDKSIPDPVAKAIRKLWVELEFGNDNYYFQADGLESYIEDMESESAKVVLDYLKDNNINLNNCLIHYWW